MAALNILVEAAKLVEYEYDKDCIYANRKKSMALSGNDRHINSGTYIKPGLRVAPSGRLNQSNTSPNTRRGTRETHNILEKNRRADMKNYFQKLKGTLPKLRDVVKASNVSILTDAVKHIRELTTIDKDYQVELTRLRKCQKELQERYKVLKEDIQMQHIRLQVFAEVQEENKRTPKVSSSPKKMMSVEIQANENDIKAELPPPDDKGTDFIERNNRSCLSDLRNDFTQNIHSSAEKLSIIMSSKLSPLKASFPEIENSLKPLLPLERSYSHGGENTVDEGENYQFVKEPCKTSRRKRKLVAENDDLDSDNDLKIILDDE